MGGGGVRGYKIPKYRLLFPKNIALPLHFFQNIDTETLASGPKFFKDYP